VETASAKAGPNSKLGKEELERIVRHCFEINDGKDEWPFDDAELVHREPFGLRALQVLEDAIMAAGAKGMAFAGAEAMTTTTIIKETSRRMARLSGSTTEQTWEDILSGGYHRWQEAQRMSQRLEESIIEKCNTWLRNMMRIAAELVNEQRVPWEVPKSISQDDISRTRRGIRTYTRDLSYNILVAVVLVVIYFLAIYVPRIG